MFEFLKKKIMPRLMKFEALTATDKTEQVEQLTKELVDAGFERIGQGLFGIVYKHPSDLTRVWKIGGMKNRGDSYPMYAKWCMANQDLVGVPKIHNYTGRGGCFIAELDMLIGLVEYTGCKSEWDLEYTETTVNEVHSVCYSLLSGGKLQWMDVESRIGCEEFEENLGLFGTCEIIYEEFKEFASMDLHTDNMMVTLGGDFVITDPLSFGR